MESRLLTIKDVRQRLNCATSTVYRWIGEEHFPRPLHLGGMARWEEQDVQAFLDKAKLRRTKFGLKPKGARRPGRPPAFPNPNYTPKK